MKPTQFLRSGDDRPMGKYNKRTVDLSETGLILVSAGSPPQKGIASYAISGNRQRPLAGVLNAAIFNTWRRFRHQILYVAPPFVVAYLTMEWAIERNEYLNSKPGRLEYGAGEE
ncbi:ubiquinol-cytochrome C reductase complex subunit protein [Rutstroemia sp. NJR-2017a WRK4]|nr:ubiquinol-cytochrome C reductase complex subunit protein [Rutstroemia sp. NJR-2017a WRK4]PQE25590.1 ubiquinol-cytochrome c reductase complex subunit protein [Rutstroemia sp. NJR-2017a BBW]